MDPHLQIVSREATGCTRTAGLHYPRRRVAMSLIDKALKANQKYAKKHDPKSGGVQFLRSSL